MSSFSRKSEISENTKSIDAPLTLVKLDECREELDRRKTDAHLAFHITKPYMLRPSAVGEDNAAGSDPKDIQHWALVVHFPGENKTYLFEAREENGLLQARRAVISLEDIQVQFFATVKTSSKELLKKARQVETGEYDVLFNNWQRWLKEFLDLISPELSMALNRQIPKTKMKAFLDQLTLSNSRGIISSLLIGYGISQLIAHLKGH
ncbi:hypothetical protein DAPPUDRAFT_243749 [Daphnia pulex]|uniref:Uncharacterized protein n=1 Tax=Daphnia pulex TaxID=6669 RepID=E9GJK2_DAPPU|nr:hypothetical protein DAPPUDRAFT_243749 [Daphnia pulex]|eukprot:EFX80486.1 hypothetical protein DAPPUDRAFT_243749 [Daphnia pulex]